MKVKMTWKKPVTTPVKKNVEFSPGTDLTNEDKPNLAPFPWYMKKQSRPGMEKRLKLLNEMTLGQPTKKVEYNAELDRLVREAMQSVHAQNLTDEVIKQHMDKFKEHFELDLEDEYSRTQINLFRRNLTSNVLSAVTHISAESFSPSKTKLAIALKKALELSTKDRTWEERKQEAIAATEKKPVHFDMSYEQKERLAKIIDRESPVGAESIAELNKDLEQFIKAEKIQRIPSAEPCKACGDDKRKQEKEDEEFHISDVLKFGLVHLLGCDNVTADRIVKALGLSKPEPRVQKTLAQMLQEQQQMAKSTAESEELIRSDSEVSDSRKKASKTLEEKIDVGTVLATEEDDAIDEDATGNLKMNLEDQGIEAPEPATTATEAQKVLDVSDPIHFDLTEEQEKRLRNIIQALYFNKDQALIDINQFIEEEKIKPVASTDPCKPCLDDKKPKDESFHFYDVLKFGLVNVLKFDEAFADDFLAKLGVSKPELQKIPVQEPVQEQQKATTEESEVLDGSKEASKNLEEKIKETAATKTHDVSAPIHFDLTEEQKERLAEILNRDRNSPSSGTLKEDLQQFIEEEKIQHIPSAEPCKPCGDEKQKTEKDESFHISDVMKYGLVHLLGFDDVTADRFVKDLGLSKPERKVQKTLKDTLPELPKTAKSTTESEVPTVSTLGLSKPAQTVQKTPKTAEEEELAPVLSKPEPRVQKIQNIAASESDSEISFASNLTTKKSVDEYDKEDRLEDKFQKLMDIGGGALKFRNADNTEPNLTEKQKKALIGQISKLMKKKNKSSTMLQNSFDQFCKTNNLKRLKFKVEYNLLYVKSYSKQNLEEILEEKETSDPKAEEKVTSQPSTPKAEEKPTSNPAAPNEEEKKSSSPSATNEEEKKASNPSATNEEEKKSSNPSTTPNKEEKKALNPSTPNEEEKTASKTHNASLTSSELKARLFEPTGSDLLEQFNRSHDRGFAFRQPSPTTEEIKFPDMDMDVDMGTDMGMDMDKKVDRSPASVSQRESETDSYMDSLDDPPYQLPKSRHGSDSSDSFRYRWQEDRSPMPHEEMETNTEDAVVEDVDKEEMVAATVSHTPGVEADTIDEMETNAELDEMETNAVLDSSGSYEGYQNEANLAPMQTVAKSFRQLFKFRKAKDEKINLKKCQPPHYYTRKTLKQHQILQLARTCKTPYRLGPSFSEPSARGVYVYSEEDKAERGSDRKLISQLDPFMWKNKGKAVMKFKPRKRPEDAIVKMYWFARVKGDNDTSEFAKTAYFVASERRYVVHYQGNPKKGKRVEDWPDEDVFSEDSEDHDSDVFPARRTNSAKESQPLIATQKQKTQKNLPVVQDAMFEKATPVEILDPFETLDTVEIRERMNRYNETPAEQNSSRFVITNPVAGELYALNVSDLKEKHGVSDWRGHTLRDTYSWRQHYGNFYYDDKNFVERVYYTCKQGKRFKRYVYYDQFSGKVMVHYLGDESKAVRKPHGNSSKKVTAPFISASNVVRRNVLDLAKVGKKKPTEVFNETLATAGEGLVRSVTVPRNVSSVKYIQRDHRESMKLATDDLVAAVYVSDQMGTFTRQIWAYPHRNAVLISDQSIENFKEVLRNMDPEEPLVLGYDTTYKYGEFFVSTLNYRHPLMENVKEHTSHTNHEPIIPLAFFIHERRHITDHKQAFDHMQAVLQTATKDMTPSFDTVPKVFLADREFKSTYWQNTKILYCWKHIQDNCDRKLQKLGFERTQRQAFQHEFTAAMKSSSLASYDKKITDYNKGKHAEAWTHPQFMEYFNRHINPTVTESSGRWVLDEHNVKNAYKGTYNNASESINATIAQIRGENKKTMDQAMIDFKYYIDIYDYKVLSAFHGHEPYVLKEQYRDLARNPDDLPAALIMTPCQRLKSIREYWNVWEKDFSREPTIKEVKRDYLHATIQREAEWLYNQNKVEHVKSQRYWSVMSMDDKPLKVTMNPLTCECGSKTICAHVLAAKYHAGFINEFVIPTKTSNRQNMGERKSKTTGTKAHHKFETEHKGVDVPKRKRAMRDLPESDASGDSESTGKETTALVFEGIVTTSAKKPKRQRLASVAGTPKTPRRTPKTTAKNKTPAPTTPTTGTKRTVTFEKKDRMSGPEFKKAKKGLFTDDKYAFLKPDPREDGFQRFTTAEKALRDAGYYVEGDKQLRHIKKGKESREKFKYNKLRPEDYERAAELLNDWVQGYLEARFRFNRVPLSNNTFVLASDGYENKEKLAVLIHGTGKVRAGLWSRKEAVNYGLDQGSQLPYIKELMEEDYGIICLNTNQIIPEYKDSLAFAHAIAAWNELIEAKAKAQTIVIVAHSFGGSVTHNLANRIADNFYYRVKGIFLADSAHSDKQKLSEETKEYLRTHATNYVTSDLKVGSDVASKDFVRQKSAGTINHDLAPVAAFREIMREIHDIETTFKARETIREVTGPKVASIDSHVTPPPSSTKSPVESLTKDTVSSIKKGRRKNSYEQLQLEGYTVGKDHRLHVFKDGKQTNDPVVFKEGADDPKFKVVAQLFSNFSRNLLKTDWRFEEYEYFDDHAKGFEVMVSEEFDNKDSLGILISELGNADPGVWSKEVLVKEGMMYGTQIAMVEALASPPLDCGVVCLNTKRESNCDVALKIIIENARASEIFIIGHRTGGNTALNLARKNLGLFETRVKGIFLIDTNCDPEVYTDQEKNYFTEHATNYVSSEAELGTLSGVIKSEHAGTYDPNKAMFNAANAIRNMVKTRIEETATLLRTDSMTARRTSTRATKAKKAKGEEENGTTRVPKTAPVTATDPTTTRRTSTRLAKVKNEKGEEDLKKKTVAEDEKASTALAPVKDLKKKTVAEDEKASTALAHVKDTKTTSTKKLPSEKSSVQFLRARSLGDSNDQTFQRLHALPKIDIDHFQPNLMSIFRGQYKTFNDPEGTMISIYCREDGKALAYYDQNDDGVGQSEAELIKFAAAVVAAGTEATYFGDYPGQLDARVCLQKVGDEEVTHEVCMGLQKKMEALDDEISKKFFRASKSTVTIEMPKFHYPASVPLVCYERLPSAVAGPKSELVSCMGCAEDFHAECVSDELEAGTFNLSCIACAVPYNGIQWGNGKITDSCPVDNIITYVALQQATYGNVLQKLPNATAGEDLFKKCVTEAIKGNDSYVHNKLYEYLGQLEDTPITREKSLWGNPHDMIFTPLLKGGFVRRGHCSADCFRNGEPVEAGVFMTAADDYGQEIRKFEQQTTANVCCDLCNLPVTNSPVKAAPGRNPYILSFNFDGRRVSARTALENIPDSLKIGNDTFKLGMMTIQQTKRSHFMALMKHKSGQWLAYDGLYNPNGLRTNFSKGKNVQTNHFRIPYTSDWHGPFSLVSSLEYFRE